MQSLCAFSLPLSEYTGSNWIGVIVGAFGTSGLYKSISEKKWQTWVTVTFIFSRTGTAGSVGMALAFVFKLFSLFLLVLYTLGVYDISFSLDKLILDTRRRAVYW